MIWILATRGADTKLRASPFTETPIEGVHSVVYRPGVMAVPFTGEDTGAGALGTFAAGLHRISGVLFSYDGSVAETLLATTAAIDLVVRYRSTGGKRMRTLTDVMFSGDATVTVPALNVGVSRLIGVPFRVQIAEGETVTQHVIDTVDV